MTVTPAVVIYAALSKRAEDDASISSQIAKVRARLAHTR
jgi:hypothetical protein